MCFSYFFLLTVLTIMHYHLMEFRSGIFHLIVPEVFSFLNTCYHVPLVTESNWPQERGHFIQKLCNSTGNTN